jgi:hypothetical protein
VETVASIFARRREGRTTPAPWAALALGGLVLGLFSGAIFGGQVFFKRDLHLVLYPQIEAFVRAVATGSWPTWDPRSSFGQPLLADPSAEVLYPPTWLNLLIRPWTYYAVFVAVHTWWSGVGLFLLGRRLGLSKGAACASAALWITCGPFQSTVELWHHFAGACWMPWILLAADVALCDARALTVAAWGAAMGGQILAGSADMCALTACAVGAYAATHHIRWRAGWDEGNRRIVWSSAAAALVALGLTAALWMPALETVTRSARRELPSAVRTYWSVHPLSLLDFVFPNVWRALVPRPPPSLMREIQEPFLDSYYLGAAALGLAGAAFVRRPSRTARLCLFLWAASALVALGRHTPAYSWLVTLAPPLGILRYPVKALVLTGFSWALLAGCGFDALRGAEPPSRRRYRLTVVAPLAALALVAGIGALVATVPAGRDWARGLLATIPLALPPQDILPFVGSRLAVTATVATLALALALPCERRWSWAPWAAAGIALLAISDLGAYHRYLGLGPKALVLHRPEALAFLSDTAAPRLFVYDYLSPGPSARGLPSPIRLARRPEGWTEEQGYALGLQMALAYASAQRWGYRGAYEADLRGLHPAPLAALTRRFRELEKTAAWAKLLRMGAVTHVIALHDLGQEGLVPVATLPGLFQSPIRVFRVKDPLPRAYAIACIRIADDAAALARFAQPDWDPAEELVLPEGQPRSAATPFAGPVRILEERADRLSLEAEMSGPGYIVLVDTFDPGWRATVDGRPRPVLRANVAFRAVEVPAGRHVVSFVYRPRSLQIGAAVSGLTALLIAAGVVAGRRGARRAPSASGASS